MLEDACGTCVPGDHRNRKAQQPQTEVRQSPFPRVERDSKLRGACDGRFSLGDGHHEPRVHYPADGSDSSLEALRPEPCVQRTNI